MSKLIIALMSLIALACGVILLVTVSAYPYQLNLTDGTLIDLNVSNNMTNNITIYIYTTTINQTINNTVSNSYFNNTYFNNTNITNYQWDFGNETNTTNSTFDDRYVIFDNRYVEESDFISYKSALLVPTKSEFDALNTRVNNINITGGTTTIKDTSHGGLWSMMVLTFILALAGITLTAYIMKTKEGSNDSTYSFP